MKLARSPSGTVAVDPGSDGDAGEDHGQTLPTASLTASSPFSMRSVKPSRSRSKPASAFIDS